MGVKASVPPAGISTTVDVGVVGAGAMGAGIAQVAAVAGHRVRLFDTRAGGAQAAIAEIIMRIDKLVAKEQLTAEQAQTAREGLRVVDTLAEFAGCGLVIEAVVENVEAKRAVLRSVEEVVNEDTLLATNTSSLSVTAIGSALRHPERLAGMHFFNPAPLMPLVEVISGTATSSDTAAMLYATANRWGKVAVYARSTPGFIVNRVARPFYAEALRLLNEGAADCATVDAVMRESGCFRMGPFELMDLIGHDVNYAVTHSVFNAYFGDPRFTPSLLQLELVEAGFLGRKAGRGFYIYGEAAPAIIPATCKAGAMPSDLLLHGDDSLTRILAERLAKADVAFERLDAHVDGRIAEGIGFVLYRSDGRTATVRAASNGLANTVVVDLAFDEAKAARLAIAVADQASESALASAAGLLQAAGYAVSAIDDVPGMIVLRTVVMLANEAADAVNQGVCSAADCDLAMRKGVNYPRGPLEWADKIGIGNVVQVLDNLAHAYGEDRYRVSPLLRRKAITGRRFGNAQKANNG